MYVRDGECVCVELVARDRYNSRESAVFLGSIRYEVLKQVYDTKVGAEPYLVTNKKIRLQRTVYCKSKSIFYEFYLFVFWSSLSN